MPPRTPKDPCSSCNKNINKNHKHLTCNICLTKIHYKCNFLNLNDFKKLKNSPHPFFCFICIKSNIPFTSLTDNELLPFLKNGHIPPDSVSSNAFISSPQMSTHINKLNNYLVQNFSDPDSVDDDENPEGDLISPINCNYFDYEEFLNAKFKSSKSFSIFHLNIHSIQKHMDSLRSLLTTIESDDFEFDILAISESKLQKKTTPLTDISLHNYHDPISTPTEATKGGVLLYVNNKIQNFKPRPDLKIYSPKMLESAFIEILNPKRANNIIGVIYKHPTLDVDLFNNEYIRPLVSKLSLEKNKNVCIAGDFNINLLNLTSHSGSSEFFDIMTSNHLLPSISLPTKLNASGNDTLIDNVYTNIFNPDTISGNISFNVSDGHLPSFVIIPNPNQNHLPKKHNLYKPNTKLLNPNHPNFPSTQHQINQELNNLDWLQIIKPETGDSNCALTNFENALKPTLDKYTPLEKVKNIDHKRRFKPWVTSVIRYHMRNRDKILRKYINTKVPVRKASLHEAYKSERNNVIELTRKSKLTFYKSYFSANSKNLRKVWQGIKNLINIKAKTNDAPSCISDRDGNLVTEPNQISEIFCDQYTNVAQNILTQRRYEGDGDFEKFMPPPCAITIDTFTPVENDEIKAIIKKFNVK